MTKTLKLKGCAHNPTYHELKKWYQDMFEKLGWMILAKYYKYNDKIKMYKSGVMNLRDCIAKKHSKIHDLDRKDDLKIMLTNVEILIKHINKKF